jgi:predicted nucleic acid-binding protein
VVAELVYVCSARLGWSRTQVAEQLLSLLDADGLIVQDQELLEETLRLFAAHRRLDFADAYLAACALASGTVAIASFDRDFDVVPGIRRISR